MTVIWLQLCTSYSFISCCSTIQVWHSGTELPSLSQKLAGKAFYYYFIYYDLLFLLRRLCFCITSNKPFNFGTYPHQDTEFLPLLDSVNWRKFNVWICVNMWKNQIYWYISFSPMTQSCSVSNVLFTGGRGVSDFSVLKYY